MKMADNSIRFRYISWTHYGKLADALSNKIASSKRRFDLVIGIARGGLPLAMVVADQLGTKIDMINAKSYSGVSKRGKVRIISTLTESIRGKNVLVVDDLVDQGETLLKVTGYLKRYRPRSVSTAVMFKKPWSRQNPDYFLEVVNDWIVFPWERGEVARMGERD